MPLWHDIESCQYAQEYYVVLKLVDVVMNSRFMDANDSPNYNSLATSDDGSCIMCNNTINYITSNIPNSNICNGIILINLNSDVGYNIVLLYIFKSMLVITIQLELENGCIYIDTIFINSKFNCYLT